MGRRTRAITPDPVSPSPIVGIGVLECGMFICPDCRREVTAEEGREITCQCGRTYGRLPSGGIDFLQGGGFHDFELDPRDSGQQDRLREEAEGIAWRIRVFILPLVERFMKAAYAGADSPRLLDCGCGSAMAVDVLRECGAQAWGIDAGLARHR